MSEAEEKLDIAITAAAIQTKKLAEAEAEIVELREVLSLWEEHGSLSNEDCEGCRRAEYYRVTGILLPRENEQ